MGRLIEGTRTNNGSTPGTFRGSPGVYVNERKLRLLIGLPPNGQATPAPQRRAAGFARSTSNGAASRPKPWCGARSCAGSAGMSRAGNWSWWPARTSCCRRLDLVGRYRWRGFGDDLIDPNDGPRFDNAYADLTERRFSGMAVGRRVFHAALVCAKRRRVCGMPNCTWPARKCVLLEQERQVVNDLSAARRRAEPGLRRAADRRQSRRGRQTAAAVDPGGLRRGQGKGGLLHRCWMHSGDTPKPRSATSSRGSNTRWPSAMCISRRALLDYCCVALSEGSWPCDAVPGRDERERSAGHPQTLDYRLQARRRSQHRPPVRGIGAASRIVPTPTPAPLPGLEPT